MERARNQALKALKLDPDLALGHVALAGIYFYYDWDFAAAAEELRTAEEIQLDTPYLHLLKSNLYAARGRLEAALEAIERALDIDPRNVNLNIQRAQIYAIQGDFDAAIDELRHAREIAPQYGKSNAALGVAYCETGRVDEALGLLEQARTASPNDPLIDGDLGWCLARAGRTGSARRVLEEMLERRRNRDTYVDPVALARVHLGLGDTEAAYEALNDAVELRAMELAFGMQLDFRFERLADDPRYQRIVDRIGF